jgi:putative methanogenesis marker protein 8
MNNRDIHVLKYFSSFVSVSRGRVINVTEPTLSFCPLAEHLYAGFRGITSGNKEMIKDAIKEAIESKIREYGFFTDDRRISFTDVSIPFGASEMISFALRKKIIDAAVMVCEGVGTVIVDDPALVQGIGARMNNLLLTSPMSGIIKTLKHAGCKVVFENALIDQERGAHVAIKAGYRSIAVTVCGHFAGTCKGLRQLKKESGAKIVSLAVCTTGINTDKVGMLRDYADLVWSCASQEVRRIIGPLAKCQISQQIPVFVLTKQGTDFLSAYADDEASVRNLDANKQYLFSHEPGGRCMHLGNSRVFITIAKLPVSSRKEPRFTKENEFVPL